MLCPSCLKGEIDGLKSCPLCGFQTLADPDANSTAAGPLKRQTAEPAGMIEMDYSDRFEELEAEPKDMPEWRRQVARRLQEIKQKRQSGPGSAAAETVPVPLPNPESERNPVQSPTISLPKEAGNEEVSQPQPEVQPAAKSNNLAARKVISARALLRQPPPHGQTISKVPSTKAESHPARDERLSPAGQTTPPADSSEVKKLIDNVVIRRIIAPSTKSSEIVPAERRTLSLTKYEDKLTLLSRAFSGMVDLIIIALCVGAFIFAIDAFSGIVVVDTFSWINYCLLFLATYFVYSLFFLGTIGQTVGMMMTDLRVVDGQKKPPLIRQILGRLSSFIPSLLVFGVGLIWGIFDRESRCLHDRLSGTYVIRI